MTLGNIGETTEASFTKARFTQGCDLPATFERPEKWPGPRLNIKTVLSMYGDFHVKDKTAARTSYL